MTFESAQPLAVYRSAYRETSWAQAGTVTGFGAGKSYQRVCVAPCAAVLAAGTDTYALSRVSGSEETPRDIGALTLPPGASHVSLVYRDRSAVRFAGNVVLLTSLGVLVYGLASSLGSLRDCSGEACRDEALRGLAVPVGASVGLAVLGGVLAGVSDRVDADVTPDKRALAGAFPHVRGLLIRGQL